MSWLVRYLQKVRRNQAIALKTPVFGSMSEMAIYRQLSRMPVAAALGLRQQDCRQSSSDNQIDAKSCRAYSRAASVGRLCLTVCFPFLIGSGSLKPHSRLDCSPDSPKHNSNFVKVVANDEFPSTSGP